jgi:enamine deaminase RidA (YjgF/YER057c/UK114 family)
MPQTSNDITRHGVTRRWADAVAYGGTVYLCEIPTTADADFTTQATEVLNQLERQLTAAGSDKTRMLSATIYLPDVNNLGTFNLLWDAWVPEGSAPVRACVCAALVDPELQLEIQLTAALA